MKVKMVNKKIAVVQAGRNKTKTGLGIIEVIPDTLGVIYEVFEGSQFKVGQKVYFGSKREQIRMANVDVQIMEEDNIVAIVEDEHEATEETEKTEN